MTIKKGSIVLAPWRDAGDDRELTGIVLSVRDGKARIRWNGNGDATPEGDESLCPVETLTLAQEIAVPIKNRRPLKVVMHELGFREFQNGGGFVAWQSVISREKQNNLDTFEVDFILTDHDSPGAPMTWSDHTPVTLSYYEASDHHGVLRHLTKDFKSIGVFVVWAETAEYLLPDNGDGAAANGWTEQAV